MVGNNLETRILRWQGKWEALPVQNKVLKEVGEENG